MTTSLRVMELPKELLPYSAEGEVWTPLGEFQRRRFHCTVAWLRSLICQSILGKMVVSSAVRGTWPRSEARPVRTPLYSVSAWAGSRSSRDARVWMDCWEGVSKNWAALLARARPGKTWW